MNAEVIWVAGRDEAADCYNAVRAKPELMYWDTETEGLLVRSGTQDQTRLIQIAVRPWDKAWVFDARDDKWQEAIAAIFQLPETIAAHNVKFDIHATMNYGIDLFELFDPFTIFDTHWISHLYDERGSHRLKDLGVKYLRADAAAEQAKLKRLMKKEGYTWATVPLKYLVEYGGMDTIIGGELFDLLYPRIEGWAMEPLRREQRLLRPVFDMERAGIRVDQPGLVELTASEEAVRQQALEDIAELAGVEHVVPKAADAEKDWDKGSILNLASGAQLVTLFRSLSTPIPNTQAVTFYRVAADEGATDDARTLARAIITFKKVNKALSTYLYPWAMQMTAAGRIHPSFNTLGTITGRFSSSDPNFQNISKKGGLRELLIAEEGNTLVVADYNQMELRQFAHYATDERMIAAFLSGDDIYQQVSDLLNVPRSVGKMITLASQYGAGWKKTKSQAIEFAYKLGEEEIVPQLEAFDWKSLTETFHSKYKVRHLQKITEDQAMRRGQWGEAYIRTVGNRRQRPKLMKHVTEDGRESHISIFKDLGNSLIQGSCADIMKESLIAAHELGYDCRLTVHDELVVEVVIGEEARAQEELVQVMQRKEYVPPLTVEAGHGQRYGDAK